MARKADWPWYNAYTGAGDYRIREMLRAILDLHGYYGDSDAWLWRGQADSRHDLSPGIHTRIQRSGRSLDDSDVVSATKRLIAEARRARVDTHENVALPDLALLAMLQHHGAATPLLDVSLDPLVALYMAVVSPVEGDSDRDGVLFAIKRPILPAASEIVRPFDNRSFEDVYEGLPEEGVIMYSAPDVSERLRIQRGHFLLGKCSDRSARVSIPLSVEDGNVPDAWIWRRMAQRGQAGPPVPAGTDIATFKISAKFKPALRRWLEDRTGLTADFVYPTAWHQPHLEMWAKSQARLAKL